MLCSGFKLMNYSWNKMNLFSRCRHLGVGGDSIVWGGWTHDPLPQEKGESVGGVYPIEPHTPISQAPPTQNIPPPCPYTQVKTTVSISSCLAFSIDDHVMSIINHSQPHPSFFVSNTKSFIHDAMLLFSPLLSNSLVLLKLLMVIFFFCQIDHIILNCV